MFHGHSATDRVHQRPIRNRGRDKKPEYESPRLSGARDLRMNERMEHLHPNRTTTLHPFPLLDESPPCPVLIPAKDVLHKMEKSNSLLGAYTDPCRQADGQYLHLSNPSKISSTMLQSSTPNL